MDWIIKIVEFIHKILRTDSTPALVATVIFITGSLSYLADVVYKNSPQYKQKATVILLTEDTVALPVATRANSDTFVLDPVMQKGLMRMTGSADGFWPGLPPMLGESAHRYELTNYGDDAVFGIDLLFEINLREALKVENNPGARQEGPVINSHEHRISIPALEGHGGKFAFYVYNQGEQFVDIKAPETVTLELAKTPERVQVRLKQPSSQGPASVMMPPNIKFMK